MVIGAMFWRGATTFEVTAAADAEFLGRVTRKLGSADSVGSSAAAADQHDQRAPGSEELPARR